eukprot:gene4290-3106_t
MSQTTHRTLLRHPLASKRYLIQFVDSSGESEKTEVFELLSRYEAHGPIGQGTYGFVCAARDINLVEEYQASGRDGPIDEEEMSPEEMYDEYTLVAVKKLCRLFESNQPRMWLCAAREIQLMMTLNHPNVMSCSDFFIPLGGVDTMNYETILRLRQTFDSVYIVMKKMDYTLREVLDANTTPEDEDDEGSNPKTCPTTKLVLHPLSKEYRQYILYQILNGVGYLHKCRVIHRDLKPENIILDRNYTTCITDFGQGRKVGGVESFQTVLDTCTQWYAAPETLTLNMTEAANTGFLDSDSFHNMDVWSIGCIAAEMLIGRPLFRSPFGGAQQLRAILEVLGKPSEADVASILEYRDDNTKIMFQRELNKLLRGIPESPSNLDRILRSPLDSEEVDRDEVSMIKSCLEWDPRRRITIAEALSSPFFTSEGYDPEIKGSITEQEAYSVRPSDISDAARGRQFLWSLFVRQHPEVGELWRKLEQKHNEELQVASNPNLSNGTVSCETPSEGLVLNSNRSFDPTSTMGNEDCHTRMTTAYSACSRVMKALQQKKDGNKISNISNAVYDCILKYNSSAGEDLSDQFGILYVSNYRAAIAVGHLVFGCATSPSVGAGGNALAPASTRWIRLVVSIMSSFSADADTAGSWIDISTAEDEVRDLQFGSSMAAEARGNLFEISLRAVVVQAPVMHVAERGTLEPREQCWKTASNGPSDAAVYAAAHLERMQERDRQFGQSLFDVVAVLSEWVYNGCKSPERREVVVPVYKIRVEAEDGMVTRITSLLPYTNPIIEATCSKNKSFCSLSTHLLQLLRHATTLSLRELAFFLPRVLSCVQDLGGKGASRSPCVVMGFMIKIESPNEREVARAVPVFSFSTLLDVFQQARSVVCPNICFAAEMKFLWDQMILSESKSEGKPVSTAGENDKKLCFIFACAAPRSLHTLSEKHPSLVCFVDPADRDLRLTITYVRVRLAS